MGVLSWVETECVGSSAPSSGGMTTPPLGWRDSVSPTGKGVSWDLFNKCVSPTGYCLGLWIPPLRNDNQ